MNVLVINNALDLVDGVQVKLFCGVSRHYGGTSVKCRQLRSLIHAVLVRQICILTWIIKNCIKIYDHYQIKSTSSNKYFSLLQMLMALRHSTVKACNHEIRIMQHCSERKFVCDTYVRFISSDSSRNYDLKDMIIIEFLWT